MMYIIALLLDPTYKRLKNLCKNSVVRIRSEYLKRGIDVYDSEDNIAQAWRTDPSSISPKLICARI